MKRRPQPHTVQPETRDGFEALASILKQERDAARREVERMKRDLCEACRARETKRKPTA